jgi:hypothetical protein
LADPNGKQNQKSQQTDYRVTGAKRTLHSNFETAKPELRHLLADAKSLAREKKYNLMAPALKFSSEVASHISHAAALLVKWNSYEDSHELLI